jgi:predicted transcriptional regulator
MRTADKLELILLERKITVKQMAELAGLPYTTVLNYINNGNEPSYKNMVKILRATGYNIKIIDKGMDDED